MCATSAWDLEEIPLDDDDPNSLEFKILAFYAKHHVFKNPPAASSPRPPRTRSLSQRGLGSWPANDSWTQVSRAWRTSPSPEQATNLGKKKSSWRALFGVVEKEENEQSPPTARLEGQAIPELHGPSHSRARSLSNMGQHREHEGRIWGFFSPTARSSPSLCVWWSISSPLVMWAEGGHAVVPQFPHLLIFNNNCPAFLKTDQEVREWQQRVTGQVFWLHCLIISSLPKLPILCAKEPYTGVETATLLEVSRLTSLGLCFHLYIGVSHTPYLLGWMERSGSCMQKYFSKYKALWGEKTHNEEAF